MDLTEFKKEKNKLSKALENHSKSILVGEFKAFFTDHPEVEALRWTQYTPHFNDGDVCYFSRHEFEVKGDVTSHLSNKEDTQEYEDDFYPDYYLSKTSGLRDALDELDEVFSGTEDVFEAAFGDGVRVTATRAGFKVEDYDHD